MPLEAGILAPYLITAILLIALIVTCIRLSRMERLLEARLGAERAWVERAVEKLHTHNFLYDSPPFDGDSGGAIVVARTGAVIGLHKELVNAARELIEHKGGVGDRLNAAELSLQSLIRGTSVGCVAVRTDSEDVQRALVG